MDDKLSMAYYMEGLIYLVLIGIILYPLLSFLIEKLVPYKWLQRIGYILVLLGGWNILYNRGHDSVFFISTGLIFISCIIFQFIADRLSAITKWLRIPIELCTSVGLLFGTLFVIARLNNFPVTKQIIQRYPDGSFTFFAGYSDEMFSLSIFLSIAIVASKYFHLYLIEKKQKKLRTAVQQKEIVQAQLDALHAKINPHFLYNSLNTIAGLALVDAEKTRQMALALSRFFRYSINKEQTNLIRVTEEAEMVRTYLEIEKIRFGELLDYKIEVSPECGELLIPRMLLQPLVENCVKHGWKGEQETILIQIHIQKENNKLIISIHDNGVPFPDEFIPGYGLKSTYDKLELLLPNRHEVEIITKPEKEVQIRIGIQ